jgi:hypothetical protein
LKKLKSTPPCAVSKGISDKMDRQVVAESSSPNGTPSEVKARNKAPDKSREQKSKPRVIDH